MVFILTVSLNHLQSFRFSTGGGGTLIYKDAHTQTHKDTVTHDTQKDTHIYVYICRNKCGYPKHLCNIP